MLPKMTQLDPQQAIYASAEPQTPEDQAAQIRHLATIGLAACGSSYDLRNLDAAFITLFEVIHRLTDELEGRLER